MAKKVKKIVQIDLEGLITLPQAAKLIDLDEAYVRRLVKSGRIAGCKFGRNYLVDRKSALSYPKVPGAGRPRLR